MRDSNIRDIITHGGYFALRNAEFQSLEEFGTPFIHFGIIGDDVESTSCRKFDLFKKGGTVLTATLHVKVFEVR